MSNLEGLPKNCPFWQKPCGEVCPDCILLAQVTQTKVVLGITKAVQGKICALAALPMIMSNKPQPEQAAVQFGIPRRLS